MTLNPWINFNGNAEEAFTFYKSVFGGEFGTIIRFKDLGGLLHVSESEGGKIVKIMLPIGNSMLIGNDVPQMMGKVNERENRSKIHINLDSKEEADKIFTALSADGEVEFPMGNSPWGTYYGSFREKYGIEWMLEYAQL